jgi:hypothetical protein
MKELFCTFASYELAGVAIEKLLRGDIAAVAINTVVQPYGSTPSTSPVWERRTFEHASVFSGHCGAALDTLLAGVKPLTFVDIGTVYASGEKVHALLTDAVNTLSHPALTDVLAAQVGKAQARWYRDALQRGAVLLWLSLDDLMVLKAQLVVEQNQGQEIALTERITL